MSSEKKEVFEYFMDHSTAKFNRLDDRLDALEVNVLSKIDDLLSKIDDFRGFKYMWTGGLVTANAIITITISVVLAIYLRR